MTAGLEHRNGTSSTSGEKGGRGEVMGGSEKEADKGHLATVLWALG